MIDFTNGIVMLVVSAIVAIILFILSYKITNGFISFKCSRWIVTIIAFLGAIIGFIMMLGKGIVSWYGLGVFSYSLCICVFSAIITVIWKLIKK